jgi:hypothetical protein
MEVGNISNGMPLIPVPNIMKPHHMVRKFLAGKNGKVVLGNYLASASTFSTQTHNNHPLKNSSYALHTNI